MKIMPPYVFRYRSKVLDDWGLSGFVLVEEEMKDGKRIKRNGGGHISIHTFPERGYVSLDIYFHKEFNHNEAVGYAASLFGIARFEKNLIDRGDLKLHAGAKNIEKILREIREEMSRDQKKGEEPPDEYA